MALTDAAYSRLVTWLKIGLPLTALIILSTLFFLARTPDIERAIPFSNVDVEDLAREPRITEPDFSGVTPDGVAVSMTARTAKPDPNDANRFSAEGMRGLVTTPDGSWVRLSAVAGKVDIGLGVAILLGDVIVESSTGYAIRTEELTARLDASRSESKGPVDVMAPFGHLTAGQFVFTRVSGDSGSQLLVFKSGVDLIYEPGK